MKRMVSFIAAVSLSISMCMPSVLAVETKLVQPMDTSVAEVTDSFKEIVGLIDEYGYYTENKSILQMYFEKYLRENPDQLYDVVNSILSAHDKYSHFLPLDVYDQCYRHKISRKMEMGVSYRKGIDGLSICRVYSNSPAEEAGIKVGDIVTKINGEPIRSLNLEQTDNMLTKNKSEILDLVIKRGAAILEFNIKLRLTDFSHITCQPINDDITYIGIDQLEENVYEDFSRAWAKAVRHGKGKVILDLRSNPGGLILEAIKIINEMIGQTMVEIGAFENERGEIEHLYSDGTGESAKKIVILMDEYSASAAEVIAGSMRDTQGSVLVGTRSYGKGVGQREILLDNGVLIITALKTHLPKTGDYHGVGLIPDYEISNHFIRFDTNNLLPLNLKRPIKLGDKSQKTYALKQRLVLLGYMDKADDKFDADTLAAVNLYQEHNGLDTAKCADVETLKSIEERVDWMKKYEFLGNDQQLETAISLFGDGGK